MYRLLVKTHNVTGLKYLCKTVKEDYARYTGSGTYWKRHIRTHGKDITTELLFESDDLDVFSDYALKKSIELNVVESSEWANLIHENGSDSGGAHQGHKHTDAAKEKMRISHLGKTLSSEAREKVSTAQKGRKCTPETRQKMSAAKKGHPTSEEMRQKLSGLYKGRKLSPETRQKMSQARIGHVVSAETRKKLSDIQLNRWGKK